MKKTKLVLLRMQHILPVKIYLQELFHIRFQEIFDETVRNCGYDGYQRALAKYSL